MAKRSHATKTKTVTRFIPRIVPPPAIRISVPKSGGGKAKGKRRSGGRRAKAGGILGGTAGPMSMQKTGALALGGFLYGYIEKSFPQIPALPVVGKSGAIAIGAYMLGGKHGGILADVGNAAAVIAGYSFGSTGKVSGMGVAPQVSGIAAQI